MSSDAAMPVSSNAAVSKNTAVSTRSNAPVPMPRTAVPIGIADPVENARAELKAALFALEEKANIPKQVSRATEKRVADVRRFQRRNPAVTAGIIVGAALAVGAAVWGAVRLYTR